MDAVIRATMKRFGEINVRGYPAVFQPHENVNATIRDDRLEIEIDFYCQRLLTQDSGEDEEFDTDRWEREMLVIDAPASRQGWREAWRVARALLHGTPVAFACGRVLSRNNWLEHCS